MDIDLDNLDLNIIFNKDFKKLKDNFDFYDKLNEMKMKEFERSESKINENNVNKEILSEYLDHTIKFLKYSTINIYLNSSNNEFIIIPNREREQKYEKFIMQNPQYKRLLFKYSDFFRKMYLLSKNIFYSTAIKELYNSSLKKEYIDAFNKVENYDNSKNADRMTVDIPFDELTHKICENDELSGMGICKESNVRAIIDYYQLFRKYSVELSEKINDIYYLIYTLLYFNNNDNVCKFNNLINENDIDQIYFDLNTFIILPEPTSIIENKYGEEIIIDDLRVVYNKKLKNYINNCLNKFIILNLSIVEKSQFHRSVLIYNPNTEEVEIFDPEFVLYQDDTDIITELTHTFVKRLFPQNTKYTPREAYITHNIQDLQEDETCSIEIGHCASWTVWYIEQRLKYPKLDAKSAFKEIFETKIKPLLANKDEKTTEMSNFIKKYVQYIKNQRKTVIEKTDMHPEIKELLIKEWNL